MISIISCKDYLTVIEQVSTVTEAVERCREIEAERNDGYAVCAWNGSRYVADAEGAAEDYGMSQYERQEVSGDAY